MKKQFKVILVVCIIAIMSLGSAVSASASSYHISKSKAVSVALKKAKVSKSSVKKWTKTKLDKKDKEWDIEFRTKNYKYEVEINSLTGKVKDFDKDKIKKSKISKSSAKNRALKATKVKSSSVKKWVKVVYDSSDNEWDVVFNTASYRYEVEVSGRNGKILDIDKERIIKSTSNYIGETKAKAIALEHAKNQIEITGNVQYTKAKLDRDDGQVSYEVEFLYNGYEFDYEIEAKTGRILDWEID